MYHPSDDGRDIFRSEEKDEAAAFFLRVFDNGKRIVLATGIKYIFAMISVRMFALECTQGSASV